MNEELKSRFSAYLDNECQLLIRAQKWNHRISIIYEGKVKTPERMDRVPNILLDLEKMPAKITKSSEKLGP